MSEFVPQQSDRFLNSVVNTFLAPGERVEEIKLVSSGFSGATIARVTTNLADYALRGWPQDSLPAERIRELHAYLNHLNNLGLPVAVPVRVNSGETLVLHIGQFWQCEPWLPGIPATFGDCSPENVQSIMQTLASLHLASERFLSQTSGQRWFSSGVDVVPAVIERAQLIQSWQSASTGQTTLQYQGLSKVAREICVEILSRFHESSTEILHELKSLSSLKLAVFPCWRDMHREHILLTNRRVTGIIDASATRTDHPATDLSRFLGSLWGDDFERWELALDQYRQHRSLTSNDLKVLIALDRSSVLLSGLTWVERWCRAEVAESREKEVLERMHTIASRMKRLHAPENRERYSAWN
ncbi:phosphotransferase [Thalassoglobus sp. JC818]|uniref:phosphotransferase n=1 Tax=Thalassoglobus sp. JC818 TaxID=3232136 RepID=UPI00345B4636